MDTKEKKRPVKAGQGKTAKRKSAAAAAPAKRPVRKTAAPKREVTKPKTAAATPDVVYTPPKPFNRSRLLLRLATVIAVVIALIFGMSLFLKVDTILVSGCDLYTPYMISQASGIKIGDGLLTINDARVSGRIIAELPYVDTASIAIELPGTVVIRVTEMDVVYSIRDSEDTWWLINSAGKVVTRADSAEAGTHTSILGITLDKPAAGKQAVASDVVLGNQQAMSGASKLSAALTIAQYLEDRSLIGQIASVDVTDLTDLQLWYGQRYQVLLGDTTELGYKITLMDAAINGTNGLKEYDSGVLDITLKLQDGVIYEAFE